MAQRMYHESGQDGRSVLGMLAVQVEKDPKTGATVVRSVAPASAPAGPQMSPTIFDDGRKTIHTVGRSGAQPSSEELEQILSVIDGVGMKALLDEVTITPTQVEAKVEKVEVGKAPKGKVLSVSTHQAMSQENSWKRQDLEGKFKEDSIGSVAKTVDNTEVKKMMVVRDSSAQVEVTEGEMLCDGPVTLVFMGYSDGPSDSKALGSEEHEGMLMAERVIITDDEEELVSGQDPPVTPQSPLDDVADQESDKESREQQVFQDIPLEGNSAQVPLQGQEGEKVLPKSSTPSITDGQVKPKRKTCQCCMIM